MIESIIVWKCILLFEFDSWIIYIEVYINQRNKLTHIIRQNHVYHTNDTSLGLTLGSLIKLKILHPTSLPIEYLWYLDL